MAKALQGVSKCVNQRMLLSSTSVCTSNVNFKQQQASLWTKRKYESFQDMFSFFHNRFNFTFQEFKWMVGRKIRQNTTKEMLDQFNAKPTRGEVAKFIMKQGGKVKFVNDSIWYQKEEQGHLPLPIRQIEHSTVDAIDATLIEAPKVWIDKICIRLSSLLLFRMNHNLEFDDWCIHSLVENCPNLEALDIRGTPTVTDNGLQMLYKLRNLKVVDISGCTGIKCAEAVYSYLLEFNPDLLVLGLDTLKENDQSANITHHEQSNCRYLNWGYIMDHRLGLKNCAGLESGHEVESFSAGQTERQTDSDVSDSSGDMKVHERV